MTKQFVLLTVLGVALAWVYPPGFAWITDGSIRIAGQPLLSVALGTITLAMGLTLRFEDHARLARLPRPVAIGTGLQFMVMPLSGRAIAQAM